MVLIITIITIIAIIKAQIVCNTVATNATKKLVFFQFQKKHPISPHKPLHQKQTNPILLFYLHEGYKEKVKLKK
jgi:hypothetical protein